MYASESISLAMLELLVQVNKRTRLKNHVCTSASFNESVVEMLEIADLPSGWDARPYTSVSQDVGDRWLDEERSLILRVPTVVNPHEYSLLINPLHPKFDEIDIGEPFAAPFDRRLVE